MFLFEFLLCVMELKVNGRNSRYLIPLRIGSPHKMDSACMDLCMQKNLKESIPCVLMKSREIGNGISNSLYICEER